jgi:hypothetical protein
MVLSGQYLHDDTINANAETPQTPNQGIMYKILGLAGGRSLRASRSHTLADIQPLRKRNSADGLKNSGLEPWYPGNASQPRSHAGTEAKRSLQQPAARLILQGTKDGSDLWGTKFPAHIIEKFALSIHLSDSCNNI